MAITEEQARTAIVGYLDQMKATVLAGDDTFADKLDNSGVIMKAIRMRPARSELPHAVVMLAVSNLEGPIANIRTAFESWGGRPSTN